MLDLKAASYEDIAREKVRIANEITRLNADLTNKNRTHPNGRRFTDHEFHAWRVLACQDLATLTGQAREVKLELKLRENEAPPRYPWLDRPSPKKLGPRDLKAMAQAQNRIVSQAKQVWQREEAYLADVLAEIDRVGLIEKELAVDLQDDASIIAYLEARGYYVERDTQLIDEGSAEEVKLHFERTA